MLLSIILILFAIVTFRNILFWVSLWQLKEYRLDRLLVHLTDTRQGKKIIISHETLALSIVIALYIVGIFSDSIAVYFPFIVFIFFAFYTSLFIREIINHTVKRPVATAKAIGIIILSLSFVAASLVFSLTDFFIWIIFLELFLPYIVACIVFLFAFPTEIYTDMYMQKAKEKRKKLLHLKVIAVSGSYGKSSTKEIIAHILSQKYAVVKTPLSQNTPLAIAKTILAHVKVSTDFFIVELGAYKKGEIKQLADMVGPTLSVTTSVSDQHLALYGSMNDVVLSEFELIESLPKDAIMLFNGNSKGSQLLVDKVKKGNIFWYKTSNNASHKKNTIYGTGVTPFIGGVRWTYMHQRKTLALSSPLFGEHTVENILPGVFLGLHFGLTEAQIIKAIKSLTPLQKTMEKISLIPGITAIDDTFNASPESVASAISYLRLFPHRKILVLSPLIELGTMSRERHKEIGRLLAGIDIVCITNKNFLHELQEGIREMNGKTKVITGSYGQIALFLKKNLQTGDAIVFEGKEAGIVKEFIK